MPLQKIFGLINLFSILIKQFYPLDSSKRAWILSWKKALNRIDSYLIGLEKRIFSNQPHFSGKEVEPAKVSPGKGIDHRFWLGRPLGPGSTVTPGTSGTYPSRSLGLHGVTVPATAPIVQVGFGSAMSVNNACKAYSARRTATKVAVFSARNCAPSSPLQK